MPKVGHVTVLQLVYHQLKDGPATLPVEKRYAYDIESDEQPYIRWLKVGKEEQQVDVGWLTTTSMVVISNEEKKHTLELYLAHGTPAVLIPPMESVQLRLSEPTKAYLVCTTGTAKCQLVVLPR